MILFYIAMYFIGYAISVILMHKFHKELDLDYNKPKTYVDCDDWDNNAQAFAGISVAWPLFWGLTLIIFIIKKVVGFSASVERYFNKTNPYLDKLKEDNKQLQDSLNKIRQENEELRKNLNK